jgi:hypothetical protein
VTFIGAPERLLPGLATGITATGRVARWIAALAHGCAARAEHQCRWCRSALGDPDGVTHSGHCKRGHPFGITVTGHFTDEREPQRIQALLRSVPGTVRIHIHTRRFVH